MPSGRSRRWLISSDCSAYFEQVEARWQELSLRVASVPAKVLRSSSLRRKR